MFGSRKAKNEIEGLIKTRPKYIIQDEAFQNQNIARSEAYGRDRGIQMREAQMEQEAANAVSDAKDVTSGTSGLLSTIAAIRANQDAAGRGLAQDEASLRMQKVQQLLGVNQAMIDEKDKEWNYNVNEPYQLKVQRQREKLKRAQAITDSFSGVALAVGSNAATGDGSENSGGGGGQAGGIFGAIFSDETLKKTVSDSEYGLDAVMKLRPVGFQYKWETENEHIGFIAQEVQEIIPEIIYTEGGKLKINLQEIIPVLVNAIQEQQHQIQSLKEEVASFKTLA